MSMTTCKECKKSISTTAKACPHCGAEQPKPTSRLSLALAGLVLFAIFYGVANQQDAPPKPKTAAQLQEEREFQQVVTAAKGLKAAMKNPDSFQLISAIMTEGPTICIEYRSTNSFNAVVTENYTLSDTISSSSAKHWNKHCAGKSGTDYSHARQAL